MTQINNRVMFSEMQLIEVSNVCQSCNCGELKGIIRGYPDYNPYWTYKRSWQTDKSEAFPNFIFCLGVVGSVCNRYVYKSLRINRVEINYLRNISFDSLIQTRSIVHESTPKVFGKQILQFIFYTLAYYDWQFLMIGSLYLSVVVLRF